MPDKVACCPICYQWEPVAPDGTVASHGGVLWWGCPGAGQAPLRFPEAEDEAEEAVRAGLAAALEVCGA